MIDYWTKYHDKLFQALLEHVEIVVITLLLSVVVASVLTMLALYNRWIGKMMVNLFSVVYSIPSLALFAILIPITGLGVKTAILVLVLYNQYLLLRNFIDGLNQVNPSVIEAATGMGMNKRQILFKVQIPLSIRPLITGIHLAVVSTIGIATIAASINAGGLGRILFDGLRTLNVNKIIWGSVMSAGLAIIVNGILSKIEKHISVR